MREKSERLQVYATCKTWLTCTSKMRRYHKVLINAFQHGRSARGHWHKGVELTLRLTSWFQARLIRTLALVHAQKARLEPYAAIARPYFDGCEST